MKGKKMLSLVLAVLLVLGALPAGLSFSASADETFQFEIGSVEDWNSLVDFVHGYDNSEAVTIAVKLTADIGPVTRMCDGRFFGSFDGQGHTMTVDISAGGRASLFNMDSFGGGFAIRNLTVAGTVAGTGEYTAALMSIAFNCTISNVLVTANVISSADKIGGLIGSTYFSAGIVIENCEFAGTILKTGDPAHMIGGFCGYFNDSTPSCTVTNSVFSGSYTNAKNFSTLGFYDTEDNPVGSVPCTNSFTNTPNVLDGLNWYEQALTGMNIAKAAVTNGNTTTYYETFAAAKSAWDDQTELVLLDDAAVTDVLSVSGTRSLDLHGHGLLQTADKSVLNVTDSSLTIRDSVPTTLHRITLNENSRGVSVAVGHADSETDTLKNVTGGYVTGGCAEKGGGVFVKNATLTMAGGTVIGNVADSAGGGVDAAIGTTMNLQGGAILNNAAGFNGRYGIGGGVIVGSGAALNMTGGTISGNIANASQKHSGEGGGVSAVSGSNTAINLVGSCFIRNNRSGEAANNLYLENNLIIRFSGALSTDSRIGVTMQNPGVFTEALGSNASIGNFTSDDPVYRVLRNSSGQAYLCESSSAPYQAGDTLEYGTYPQSEVTDAATLTALNAKLRSNGWISYGYYIGTGGKNGEMASGDFMRYQDVVLDGAKYRAVTFDCYRPYLTKNVSSAANSKQDENGYEPGNTYWFKFEPVTWKVLDPDSGLVLCCSAIDAQAYHNYFIEEHSDDYGYYFYWGDSDQKYRANDYAHSDIRAWLNEDFINTAFSTAQQENIKVSELDDASSLIHYDYASSADKIFLLSTDEAANGAYGFNPNGVSMDTARQMSPSDYAQCQGIEAIALNAATKASFWWLREYSGIEAVNGVTPVGIAGSFSADPFVTNLGVVPALRMQELQDDPTGAPLKVAPAMTLTAEPVTYGEDAVITATLPADADGSVIFSLVGENNTYTFTDSSITDGVAQVSQKLNADTYAVTAAYSGDAAYEPTSAKTTLTVNPATPAITITAKSMNDAGTGYEITVTKPADSTQGVMVYAVYSGLPAFALSIGNDKFENGSYTFRFPDVFEDYLSDNVSGEFELSAVYDGRNDQNYQDNIVELAITLGCAHVWNTPTWDWTDVDNPTYSTTCTLCANGQTSGSVSSTKGERVAATGEADAYTPYTATVTLDGQTFNDTFNLTEPGTMLAARKAAFNQYKADQKQAADAMAKTGDSAACAALIDAAKSAIDGVTYDESKSLDENKAAVDTAANLDQLAADLTDRRAADEVEKKINDIGNVALTDESKQKIDDARAAYDDLTDKQKALVGNKDTLETAEEAYQLLEDKDSFEQYKDELKQAAEDKRKVDDSAESKKLIDDVVAAIDAMDYDESKTLDENKAAVDDAAKLDDLAADLTDQRTADEVEKKINDIGNVALTDESRQKIDDAREAYDNLTDKQKALVDNKDTLETAEEAYQLLEDKDSFEQYKDELKQAAEDKRKVDDSDESKKLIDDVVAAIDAMDYDESKTLDENKQAVDAAADLDELTEQLKEHRAVYEAVFYADGAEIARVPYTIDTKAITAPAVPVKPLYTGAWPNYELKAGGVEINAVYTKNAALVIADNAQEQGEGRVLAYRETVTFTTGAAALPQGATLRWYVDGEETGTGMNTTVQNPVEDYTVQVKAFTEDGVLYAESELLTVRVDLTLWAKIVGFFKTLIRPLLGPVRMILFETIPALLSVFSSFLLSLFRSFGNMIKQ